jgi:hypothetical protein
MIEIEGASPAQVDCVMTAILDVAIALAVATAEFDAVKSAASSAPARATHLSRRVYEADARFRGVMRELLQKEPAIVAALRSKVSETR